MLGCCETGARTNEARRGEPGCADLVIFPESVIFCGNCQTASRLGEMRRTLRVYTLFPFSSSVYMRCMTGEREGWLRRDGRWEKTGASGGCELRRISGRYAAISPNQCRQVLDRCFPLSMPVPTVAEHEGIAGLDDVKRPLTTARRA